MTVEGICISPVAATVIYPEIVIALLIVHFCSHSREGDFVLVITLQCNCYTPPQTLFVVCILFSRSPCVRPAARTSVRPSARTSVRNVLFPKYLNESLLDLHQTLQTCSYMQDKYFKQKSRARAILLELFPFVVLNGFLNSVLCLCCYSPYMGRSTPTTVFDGTN